MIHGTLILTRAAEARLVEQRQGQGVRADELERGGVGHVLGHPCLGLAGHGLAVEEDGHALRRRGNLFWGCRRSLSSFHHGGNFVAFGRGLLGRLG